MFGIASGLDMQIRIVACYALRLHGIIRVIRGQLLDLIENILTDEITLFHPSHRAGRGTHFDKMAVMVEHFHALAIFYYSGFFVDGGHVVAEVGLNSGDVSDFLRASATAIAR